jgi:hypothetical protein
MGASGLKNEDVEKVRCLAIKSVMGDMAVSASKAGEDNKKHRWSDKTPQGLEEHSES